MADDQQLGRVCCVPRRYFCVVLGAACFSYAFLVIIDQLLFFYIRNISLTPQHCSGHHCYQIVTCKGIQDSTYRLRNIIVIGGGLLLGWQGVLGGMNLSAHQCRMFSFYLLAMVLMYIFNFVADVIFTVSCKSWPYNVVDMVVLWPFPFNHMGIPVSTKVRDEIKLMETYPTYDIWMLTDMELWKWYPGMVLVLVVWWFYAFDGVYKLHLAFDCGLTGLGPNYDLQNWRERVTIQRQAGQLLGHTIGMAKHTYGSVLADTYNATLGDGDAFDPGHPGPPPNFAPDPPVWKHVQNGIWSNGIRPALPLPIHREVFAEPKQ